MTAQAPVRHRARRIAAGRKRSHWRWFVFPQLASLGRTEHSIVKNLIGEIEAMDVGDELYDAKLRVLGEIVNHHIEEEEQELFPKVASPRRILAKSARNLRNARKS